MQSGTGGSRSAIWELAEAARELSAKDSTIIAKGLFGPLASMRDLPDGDTRVFIALKKDRHCAGFRSSPHYELATGGTSVCVEPFPVAAEELPPNRSTPANNPICTVRIHAPVRRSRRTGCEKVSQRRLATTHANEIRPAGSSLRTWIQE
ncbi:hypothetical protein ACFL0Q_02930 [Thermodesulfobacteriota bacterium]